MKMTDFKQVCRQSADRAYHLFTDVPHANSTTYLQHAGQHALLGLCCVGVGLTEIVHGVFPFSPTYMRALSRRISRSISGSITTIDTELHGL